MHTVPDVLKYVLNIAEIRTSSKCVRRFW